jgi:hypothetical protein
MADPSSTAPRTRGETPRVIALRVESPRALLPWYEPSAGGEGALCADLAAHLLAQVKNARKGTVFVLRVEVPGGAASGVEATLRAGLRASAANERIALRELFRWGRRVLAVGLIVLTVCLTIAIYGQEVLPGVALPLIVKEGMKIIGWAAMWKPTEMFFYDWMPMVRRRQLLEKLAESRIEVHDTPA